MHHFFDADPVPGVRQVGEQRTPVGANPPVPVPSTEVVGRACREHGDSWLASLVAHRHGSATARANAETVVPAIRPVGLAANDGQIIEPRKYRYRPPC